MVILNTWTECMLDDTLGQVLFLCLIVMVLLAWALVIFYKDFNASFPAFLGTVAIILVLWANQYPETFHIIDVSNASFLEVHNDYIVISSVEGSSTLYKVKEKIYELD